MFTGLTDDDFPLKTVGARVYSAKRPTPVLTACDDIMAEDVVKRLNDAQGFTAIERMK